MSLSKWQAQLDSICRPQIKRKPAEVPESEQAKKMWEELKRL